MKPHRYRHDPGKTLVGFSVGGVYYAIAIGQVREVSSPLPTVSLPHAPPAVQGVADYRGEVVPVVDLRVRFGLPKAEASRRIKWVVVDLGGRFAALIVDEMLGVFGTVGLELRPAPPLGGGEDARGILGVTTHTRGLVFVLDVGSFTELTARLALPEAPPSPALPAKQSKVGAA
jgi:purine-binding chemotaxis protein CheW